MANYFEEFLQEYQRPVMGKITVGFSGIDPSPKDAMPPSDGKLYGVKNGKWFEINMSDVELPVEKSLTVTLEADNITSKSITLPDTPDTSKAATVAIQGLVTECGVDWIFNKNKISWDGLELETIAQAGDKVFIKYYKL